MIQGVEIEDFVIDGIFFKEVYLRNKNDIETEVMGKSKYAIEKMLSGDAISREQKIYREIYGQ